MKKTDITNIIIFKFVLIFIFYIIYKFNIFKTFINDSKYFTNDNQLMYDKQFILYCKKEFLLKGKININKIEKMFIKNKILNNEIINNLINVGFTLDPGYILETILTITSIMSTQHNTTKIIFHLGVIKNFTIENMLKIYNLRKRVNNLTEFNFYNLSDSVKKMKNFHSKGEACPGKFELPKLLSDEVERLIIFDAGDLIVIRDLSELYNYNMSNYWVLGTPEPVSIKRVKKYNRTKYLNIGSLLLNVKEFKKNNIWEIYTKNRYLKVTGAPDQTLFNIIVPDDKKDYIPFRFGGISPFSTDKNSDKLRYNEYGINNFLLNEEGKNFPQNPRIKDIHVIQLLNPVFIHQFKHKWYKGSGLSIYRNLAKYFIKLAGIWEELCKKHPGYCIN